MQRLYALIGRPLGHSLSADYFNDLFSSQGIEAHYLLHELEDLSGLKPWLQANPSIVGFNVTSPYKIAVCNYLDEIDAEAKYVGAVNTVVVDRSAATPRLIGYNTDVQGVVESLQPLLCTELQHALILGTGGAAHAVAQALRRLGRDYTFVSRQPQASHILSYDVLTSELVANFGIIINATPLGMEPHISERPSIPYDAITSQHVCMDLIYNPEETYFLRSCRGQGASTINGLKMLLVQARYAWHIWDHQKELR